MTPRDDPGLPGFEPLDPPGGGLAALRRRIARHERRRATRRAIVGVAGATALVVAAVLALPRTDAARPVPAALAGQLVAMRAGWIEPPVDPVTVPPERRADTAVQRVATRDERVVYYLVGAR